MNFFVTGGARGIGAAIVLEAVRQGHEVGFTYRTSEQAAADVVRQARHLRADARCRAYALDVRDSRAVEEVGDRFIDDYATAHVVVPNAAVNRQNLLVSMSDDEWHDVIQTNLTGAFYVCRQFLQPMLANRFGRFITISSIGHAGLTGQANYCASKAGLHGLSATIAKEYGSRGITSNVVVPGFFETDMTRKTMSVRNRRYWLEHCPTGRLGDLHEIAQLVLFLASPGAAFINGQAIPINGGLDWAP